ncbi:MAG: AAA family ATPase [Myxococcota bacterium]
MPDPIPEAQLRWRCPATYLDFSTTADLMPAEGVVGQEAAAEALRFGLSIDAHGQNLFVRGLTGSGRLTLIRDLLRTVRPGTPEGSDQCYVHDFGRPDQPRLLTLAPGQAPKLRGRMDELVRFALEDLSDLVNTDGLRVRTHELEATATREAETVSRPFDQALAQAGLALVGIEADDGPQPAIVPIIDGQPTTFDDLDELVEDHKFDASAAARLQADAERLEVQLENVSAQVVRIRRRAQRAVRRLMQQEVVRVLRDAVADIRRTWPETDGWLDDLMTDVARRLSDFEEHPELAERYRVNVLVSREPGAPRAVVIENVPTVQNLLGTIDPSPNDGQPVAAHLGIHAGAVLRADGGTLILNARDVLSEPMAWNALMRTLRTGVIELSPQEMAQSTIRPPGVKPAPIPVNVKVVLVGEPDVWYALDEADPDFPHLFKVLADFDDVIPRDATGIALYGGVIARIARDEQLPAFTSAAVGALVEFGAREAALSGKLTARFGRIADLAREAAFLAMSSEGPTLARGRGVRFVDRDDVDRAILANHRRADLPGRKFREHVAEGRIRIRTTGEEVGEMNGLAVVETGTLAHGFPTRITATVGPGIAGTVHIEREAELSGQIHTKGFLILRGLLRHLLRTKYPLAFDASITHEQSYGGIDGDSASGAEFCALVSALTGMPIRQSVAMTGAIDQHGNVLPVGAVNEKIEGFFDVCAARGLDAGTGVLVPRANLGDLQLRRDVVHACRANRFAVWGIERIEEAIALLFGHPAGSTDSGGRYPDATVLGRAVLRAEALWIASAPARFEP